MYACLHAIHPVDCDPNANALLALAHQFSPEVEQTSPDTVVFSITPLRKLMGSPHQIASEISRFGFVRKLKASLAIAPNPDTAILLARNCLGVTMVAPGEERFKLGPLLCSCLFHHGMAVDPSLAQVLHGWGVKTCEELAALPEKGVVERLGRGGLYLYDLASGRTMRPLRLPKPEVTYEEHMQLEHAISNLEPLLFLFARTLNELCARLRSQSKAARVLEARLVLEQGKAPYGCELEFPVPLDDHGSILKLLQLHLEHHPPGAAITAFSLRIEPADPKRVQKGFFLPPTPPPDKLQITLARIAGMVGAENVGTPLPLNTHRPDAFEMVHVNTAPPPSEPVAPMKTIRLAMRLFRPALHARVTLSNATPKHIAAVGVRGNVVEWAGPWKTSGEWWTHTSWTREEWDVALDDGALYRIYEEPSEHEWFVGGIYD